MSFPDYLPEDNEYWEFEKELDDFDPDEFPI